MKTKGTSLPIMRVLCACVVLVASGGLGLPTSFGDGTVQEYTVSSSAGSNGTIDPDGDTIVTKGDDLSFTAAPAENYQVDEWSVDGVVAQSGGTDFSLVDVTTDHSVDVTFRLVEFTVSSASGPGGTISPDGDTTVTSGGGLDLTATPDTGYKIDTWSVDGVEAQTGGEDFSLANIQADHSVDVSFRLLEFEVESSAGANGAIDPDGTTVVTYGSDLDLTATPDTGYQVDKWSLDGAEAQTGGDSFSLVGIQSNHSVDVTFKLLEFEVTASAGSNGSVSPATSTVTYGSDLDFTATPDTGYQVDKWSVSGGEGQTGGNSFSLTDIKADHSVDVTFKLLEFEISGTAGSNGAISPDGDTTVTYGSDLEFTAAPEGEYLVRIWSVDGEQVQIGGDSYMLTNIMADHSVDVSFSLLYYIVSPSAGSYGSIEPDYDVTAEPGDSLDFSATPDDEYVVRAWFANGSIQLGDSYTFTLSDIQSDTSVEVEFMPESYDIEATAGPGGSVSPKSVGLSSGGNVTFTATPDVGYEVDEWIVDGAVVQRGGLTYEIGLATPTESVHVTFKRMLTYSLGIFEFDGEQETKAGIVDNNSDPDQALVSVEPIGLGSDPDDLALCLRNQKNGKGQTVNARAKAMFDKTDADVVLISFKYLFASSTAELVIYLSDTPELLAADEPARQQHYIEVARLAAPPSDRPGSESSERFGVFEEFVSTGGLDLSNGLYVELELIDQADGGSVCIDSWGAHVPCNGDCLDINGDSSVDEADFLKVLAASGLAACGKTARLEGVFSADGYIDLYDVASWDWATASEEPAGISTMSFLPDISVILSDLMIAGKRDSADAEGKVKDSLYAFDAVGEAVGTFEPASNRGNIRLVKGPEGQIYQINSETGLVRLDGTGEAVVPPGKIELAGDPRNGSSAVVYIGIQGEGSDAFGRPVLDVAVDADYVYVVPVVVDPDGAEPYTAAAKLKLSSGGGSPYELVELYDDAPPPNDNQKRNNLREIELDGAGNVYVLNVNSLNESDILWKYAPDGTVERADLGRPDGGSYVPAPIAMHVSQTDGALYMASATDNGAGPASSVIYRLSTQSGPAVVELVTIDGLNHVTAITEDPATGTLWIVGFNMDDIPEDPDPAKPAFYYPYLASISGVDDSIMVMPLFAPASHDLALPMSILWTGAVEPGPVQ